MKRSKQCVFRNSSAAKRMAAAYRKQMGLGIDGLPRRYGKPKSVTHRVCDEDADSRTPRS